MVSAKEDALARLQEVGFERAGYWTLLDQHPVCVLDLHGSACDVLYAFVAGRHVLYLGQTRRSLRQRMYGYQRPGPTQRTNIACHKEIVQALSAELGVDVYVFRDPAPRQHAGVPINLAAGLEAGLIREFEPPWNKLK